MKARLYSSQSSWNSRHSSIMSHLNIPTADGKTTTYATCMQVDNESHADHGKYIFPVCTEGEWKCDDQFPSSDLVNYDNNWFAAPDE